MTQPTRSALRPTGMRTSFLGLLALLAALAVAPYPQAPARASCAGPYLELDRKPVLERGQSVTVAGVHFVDGCRDTMSCSAVPGCGGCHYDDPPPQPMTGVDLELRQSGRTWVLDTQDADESGDIVWEFELPEEVQPGPARLRDGRASWTVVRVR